MIGKYKVITLCGSTKFKEDFLREQKILTLEGNIVISVGLFGHSGDNEVWSEGTKEMLDDMHKRKIDMADEIFVINVNGYIGESTKSEIEYAKSLVQIDEISGNAKYAPSCVINNSTSKITLNEIMLSIIYIAAIVKKHIISDKLLSFPISHKIKGLEK